MDEDTLYTCFYSATGYLSVALCQSSYRDRAPANWSDRNTGRNVDRKLHCRRPFYTIIYTGQNLYSVVTSLTVVVVVMVVGKAVQNLQGRVYVDAGMGPQLLFDNYHQKMRRFSDEDLRSNNCTVCCPLWAPSF